jgi:hypothetical protein
MKRHWSLLLVAASAAAALAIGLGAETAAERPTPVYASAGAR